MTTVCAVCCKLAAAFASCSLRVIECPQAMCFYWMACNVGMIVPSLVVAVTAQERSWFVVLHADVERGCFRAHLWLEENRLVFEGPVCCSLLHNISVAVEAGGRTLHKQQSSFSVLMFFFSFVIFLCFFVSVLLCFWISSFLLSSFFLSSFSFYMLFFFVFVLRFLYLVLLSFLPSFLISFPFA